MPYKIRFGDTLYSIARKFGVSVGAIMDANIWLDNEHEIPAGAVIKIPTPDDPGSAGTQPYIVQRGDTLYSIARQNRVSVRAIMRANPWLRDPHRIRAGTSIDIPLPRTIR